MKITRVFIFALVALLLTGAFASTAAASEAVQAIPQGVVNTNQLNVRDYPLYPDGNIIARVRQNEVYVLTARSSINYWFQLRLGDGRLGWVNGRYLDIYNAHLIPTIDPGPAPNPVPPPAPTQSFGVVTAYYLNVRAIPNWQTGAVLLKVQRNEVYPVVGRNADSSWWQIRLANGTTGWVSGSYLSVTNPQLVPQTDNTVPPGSITTTATVTAFFLNVRNAPNAAFGSILSVISRNQTYPVVGRTSTNSWWQIRLPNNTTGWVSGLWVYVANPHNVPVTY